MTNKQLLAETAEFMRTYFGSNYPRHDQIGGSEVYAYSNSSTYEYLNLTLEGINHLGYTASENISYTDQELAICFSILALAKSMVEASGAIKRKEVDTSGDNNYATT
ncbi:MAG: hypothetical protein LC803_09455 [Acidobacteria bacterium]|nr:hypothetical protein [Acidobacteriota bacterium]